MTRLHFARIGALLGPVLGLALVLAACTAQPVRTLSEIPDRLGNRSPAPAPGMAAPQVAPAPPMVIARPSNTSAVPRAARIDEVYPGRGDTLRPGGSTPRQTAPGDIDLTFEGADIREVLRVVLGDLLGTNYVVDPNVTGTVSLTTNRPLRREDLLPVLEGVLASQGVRILNYGQTLRVTRNPDAEALAQGGISTGAGGSFRVFTLDHMSVADMRSILEPMLPQGAISGANEARGIIIVAGSAAVLRLAAGTVDIFDVDQMAGQTSALVTLESGDARTVVAELASIFGAGGTRVGEQGPLQLLPIERMNGVLILSRQRALVEQAREWIYRLDRRSDPTEKRVYVYYVQHGGAQRLADALKEIVGNRAPAAAATPEPTPVSTTAGAQTAVQAAARLIGDDVRIAIDGERNALLIATSPANFRIIEEVLTRLDIQPLQVLIEASIFEVTLGDTLRFGIQYALNTGGIGGSDRSIIGLGRGTATENGPGSIVRQVITPIAPGFNFTLEGAAATRLVIDALSDLTEVNMLSSPNVIVLNNNTAALNVGDEVPIITQSTTSAVTDNPLIVNTVQYRQTGVSLEVTPQANASGMVTLQLSQTVSDVRTTTSSTIDSPTIQNRSLLSTVTVRSGETIMLGGLIREQASTSKTGIPLLNDLPIVGPLFGAQSRSANRTELVALIRPVIIGSAEEAAAVTTTLRNKFLGLVRQEQEGIRQPRRPITSDR